MAGDRLMVLIRTVIQEAGTGTVYTQIGNIELQVDIKGRWQRAAIDLGA